MRHRKISDVIDDLVLHILVKVCGDPEGIVETSNAKIDELKEELEASFGAMVGDYVQKLKETGVIK